MRRGLRFIIDPEPEAHDKQRVRDFFQNQCAYCGTPISGDTGDIDHLVSAALGGANGLANRVLSCKTCNAQEKRDRDWTEFLQAKSPSQEVFRQRQSRIQGWIELNGGHAIMDAHLLAVLTQEADSVTKEYDASCARIRTARAAVENHPSLPV